MFKLFMKANLDQAYIVLLYSALAIVSLGTFGILHALGADPLTGALEIIGASVIGLNIIFFFLTRNFTLTRTILLLTVLVMIIVMIATGGTEKTGLLWSFMFPVCAFFLAGKKEGLMWVLALFGALLLVIIAELNGLVSIAYSVIELRQLLITLIVISFGIYAHQRAREAVGQEKISSQQETKEEKLKAEAVVDNIDEGVIATDVQGRVLFINPAGEHLLGWAADELIGKNFIEAVPMIDEKTNSIIKPADRPLMQAITKDTAVNTLGIYQRKDGTHVPVAITGRGIVVDGKLRGLIGTFRDVTEERAINRTKSEFIALASHQLRTPLSAINWVSELLLHGDAGKIGADQREYIEQIYRSNKRMSLLVDAMLTASSLELGTLPARPEAIDISHLCREVLAEQLKLHGQQKHLKIHEDFSETPTIYHDPMIIKTILANLTANAIKYTPDKGTVTISVRSSNRKLEGENGKNLLIEVVDTGMGIPKNEQIKIFTKLFRAANIKKQDTDGTGLGLYIAKAAVEYIGGKLWFRSNEGEGSTFSVLLPMRDPAAAQVKEAK